MKHGSLSVLVSNWPWPVTGPANLVGRGCRWPPVTSQGWPLTFLAHRPRNLSSDSSVVIVSAVCLAGIDEKSAQGWGTTFPDTAGVLCRSLDP